jgi:hypothetical protein
MAGASLRISTLCLALVISASVSAARADESTEGLPSLDDDSGAPSAPVEAPPPEPAPIVTGRMEAPPENLSAGTPTPTGEIEAKAYDVRTVRPSKSGRVYLFVKDDAAMPPPGKLFLLRDGATPVMAFRVLRTYPAQKRIAAKKLRAYPGFDPLGRGSRFRAFEKVGDRVVVIPPSPEDLNDLQELEAVPTDELPPAPQENVDSVAAPQEEIPAEEPPPPAETLPAEEQSPPPEEKSNSEELYESEDDELEVRDEEDEDIDSYYPNQFSMEIGLLPNADVPGPTTKFGGGLRYARNLGTSWAIEGGFFYYKSTGDVEESPVTMTVVPLIGTLRWQTRLAEIWTGYLYAGVMYPYVASQIGASTRMLATVQTISPALGAGIFLRTGPNWYLRLNLGTDAMTAGVMLRY